jgi:hypothetical protein
LVAQALLTPYALKGFPHVGRCSVAVREVTVKNAFERHVIAPTIASVSEQFLTNKLRAVAGMCNSPR